MGLDVERIRFGPYELDRATGELTKFGHKLRLQDQPFQILVLLLARPGEVVTREQLQRKLWSSDTFVDFEHGLNNAIKRLREILIDSAEKPRYIETLPRRGYRFIAPVEEPVAAATSPVEATASVGAHTVRTRSRWELVAAAAVLVLALIAAAGWRPTTAGTPPIHSLAVLPLQNRTGDPGQDYFVDGMTDELTTSLAQTSALRVISRTSMTTYTHTHKQVPQIGRELNVDGVVEGSVARSGERVRINVQLVQASTDRHLWANSYEGDLKDVLALQREVASAITAQIRIHATPREEQRLSHARVVNPAAYEEYLKGKYGLSQWSAQGVTDAIEHFRKAIELDANYAPAYAQLAIAHNRAAFFSVASPAVSYAKAEAAATKAIALDPDLWEAHMALAMVRWREEWDWRGADLEFQRALELSPQAAEAHHHYSVYLRTMGRFDEAIEHAKRSVELDPVSTRPRTELGAAYLIASRYEEATAEYRKTLQQDSSFALAHFQLGVTYLDVRDYARASQELEAAVSLSHRLPGYVGFLGNCYAVSGRTAEARQLLKELESRSRTQYVSPYYLAVIHVGLGDKSKAVQALNAAYQQRSFEVPTIVTWRQFDALRNYPPFQELVDQLAIPLPASAGRSAPRAP